MPCVEDGTERFLELLAGIRKGDHTLPDSFVYLLISGLFSNHSPLYFVGTKRFFSKMGLACHIAKLLVLSISFAIVLCFPQALVTFLVTALSFLLSTQRNKLMRSGQSEHCSLKNLVDQC